MIRLLPFLLVSGLSLGATAPPSALESAEPNAESQARARLLKESIQRERPLYQKREGEKRGLLEALDRLNSDQNQIRDRVATLEAHQQEVAMARDNLAMEVKRQHGLEQAEKKRLAALFKVVYRIKRDGVLRYLLRDDEVTHLPGRFRVLIRALRSHTLLTRQLEERASRLKVAEAKLELSHADNEKSLAELNEQQALLKNILAQKKGIVQTLQAKQGKFEAMLQEYKVVSAQLRALFDNLEAQHAPTGATGNFPARGSLPLPLEGGQIVKAFGKSVSEKFGTVLYQKGIEIEAPHNTPVKSVLAGIVEFEGWVRGLGNVVIVHHGNGFYSLSGHLFKTEKEKGTQIEQGEVIGYVGDTGNSPKPGLYFELRENSRAVDPKAYFQSALLQNIS